MNRKTTFILLTVAVGSLLFGYLASGLRFSSDALGTDLIPADKLQYYQKLSAPFESQNKGEILYLESDKNWLRPAALKWLDSTTRSLPNALSLVTLEYPFHNGFTVQKKRILNPYQPKSINHFTKKWPYLHDITDKFLSRDAQISLIYLENDEPTDLQLPLERIRGSGFVQNAQIFGKQQYLEEVQSSTYQNMVSTLTAGLILIAITFFLLTRSLNHVFITLVTIAYNLLIVAGITALLRIEIGPQMSAIPVLIAVMSFSDILHLLHFRTTLSPRKKTSISAQMIQTLRTPLFFTSLTNAVGFMLYLLFAQNRVLLELGIIGLVGIIITYLVARFLVLHYLSQMKLMSAPHQIKDQITGFYEHLLHQIKRFKTIVLISYLGGIAAAILYLIPTFEFQGIQSEMMTGKNAFGEAQQRLNRDFFGESTLEIYIDYPHPDSLLTPHHLQQLILLEHTIDSLWHPLYQTGPLTIMRRYNRFRRQGHFRAYHLPENASEEWLVGFKKWRTVLGWNQVVRTNCAKIQWGLPSFTMHQNSEKIAFINELFSQFETTNLKFELTGKQRLQVMSEYNFVMLVLLGFLAALLLAAFLMYFWLGSIWKVILFFLINLAPLLAALCLLFYFQIPFNSLSVFILSILVGLCLDDSIYMVTTGQKEPLKVVYPIIVTTLVIVAGTMAFLFSSFSWLQPFAWIFTISFIVALISDIFVLPILLIHSHESKDD